MTGRCGQQPDARRPLADAPRGIGGGDRADVGLPGEYHLPVALSSKARRRRHAASMLPRRRLAR